MSPIDTTLWNGTENFSPRSQAWLKKEIPLFDLDELMGLNPIKNSIKTFDPTGEMKSLSTAGNIPKVDRKVISSVNRPSGAKISPRIIRKKPFEKKKNTHPSNPLPNNLCLDVKIIDNLLKKLEI